MYLGPLYLECECINTHCLVDSKLQCANMAMSLDDWLWAVSSLVVEKIQVSCLTDMYIIHITSQLQIISVENGCEGYIPNVSIPAESKLTGSIDTSN